ncbi:MAG TPA: NF038122 family metalloprotease [Blastocatellia bacterium]|nr:NF038122 family metalloprotease [Blastocatellia bacterium]
MKQSGGTRITPAGRLACIISLLVVCALVTITPSSGAQDNPLKLTAGPPEAGVFVRYWDGENVSCRNASREEAIAIKSGSRGQQLRVLPRPHRRSPDSPGALTIILRGTAQLDDFPLARDGFIAAAQKWENVIQDNITIIIDVDFGPTRFGFPYPPGVLGSTSSQDIGHPSLYPTLRQALIDGASSADETTLYNALPASTIPTTLGNTTSMFYPSAAVRAQGLINPVADPPNETDFGALPAIGFNSAFSFDFDPSDGIDANKIDFDAVAVHEIGHALGFVSHTGLVEIVPQPLIASVWDLFRFNPGVSLATFPTAQRILSSGGTQVYFDNTGTLSPGGSIELSLSTGRPDGSGGDGRQASHWKDNVFTGETVGIMDPTLGFGERLTISNNDLLALDRMGYEVLSCVLSTSTDSESFPGNGGTGSFGIAGSNGCTWTAVSNDSWIHITSGSSGSGNGTVSYSVDANPGATIRSGTITAAGQTFTVFQGINFLDVPPTDLFYTAIGKLSARGITSGCGGGNYCPNQPVTRDQMAAFIVRALGEFNPPPPAMQRFLDVPPTNIFYAFIDRLAELQITAGCGGGNYCPASPVLRQEMAAFIIRALGEFNPPPPAVQRFLDVPPTSPFYAFIDQMAVRGITAGCGGGNYCPLQPVTRAQMATFLVLAFDL